VSAAVAAKALDGPWGQESPRPVIMIHCGPMFTYCSPLNYKLAVEYVLQVFCGVTIDAFMKKRCFTRKCIDKIFDPKVNYKYIV